MPDLSLNRCLVASFAFALAFAVGVALTPSDGAAWSLCDDMSCRTFPANACQPDDGQYCHDYSWDCWDGPCAPA